jgi:hypothetical protein
MPDSSEHQKTYLLDDIEVVFTGRTAKRSLKNDRIDERFEVKPSNNELGSWTKWVRITDLYEIE